MQFDDDKYLALKVAIFNALGFGLAALVTSYVDPQLTTHVTYHARTYRWGYWSVLLAVPIFVATFQLIGKCKQPLLKCIAACVPLLVCGGIAVLFVFRPEFPHGNITTWVLGYCALSVLTIGIRYAGRDLTFLGDTNIAVAARIEAVKTRVTIWQTLAVAVAAAYIAIIGVWVDKTWNNSGSVVTAASERFVLAETFIYEVLVFSMYAAAGPIKEAIAKTLNSAACFADIIDTR